MTKCEWILFFILKFKKKNPQTNVSRELRVSCSDWLPGSWPEKNHKQFALRNFIKHSLYSFDSLYQASKNWYSTYWFSPRKRQTFYLNRVHRPMYNSRYGSFRSNLHCRENYYSVHLYANSWMSSVSCGPSNRSTVHCLSMCPLSRRNLWFLLFF